MIDFTIQELKQAFDAVKANQGCAGVDGMGINAFDNNISSKLQVLRIELAEGTYKPLPLLKILVAKKNGEPRELCIPSVCDRVAQKALLHRIEPILDKEFEDCSYAYRKGRSIRQAVLKIKSYYEDGFRWVVDADIDAFFDNVDHHLLIEKLKSIIADSSLVALLQTWLEVDVWDGSKLKPLKKGIPQGSSLSPIMANLFLDELDEEMLQKGFRFIRYSDDFIILCKNPKRAREGLELSKRVLNDLLLELDEEEITSFEKGFKYLGVYFLNSLIMQPYPVHRQKRTVLYYPPPLDLKALDAKCSVKLRP